jgi:hypothetical protein
MCHAQPVSKEQIAARTDGRANQAHLRFLISSANATLQLCFGVWHGLLGSTVADDVAV